MPFLHSSSDEASDRLDGLALLLIALHLAALLLFVAKPLAGSVAIAVAAIIAIGFKRPLLVLLLALTFLWINVPLGDFYPEGKYTAWKDVLLVFVFAGWLVRHMMERTPLVVESPISRPLLCLVAAFLASCILSPSLVHAVLGLKACVFYAALFFVLPDLIQSKRDVRALIAAIVVCTACLAIYNMWAVQQPYGFYPPDRAGRVLPGALMVHWSPASGFLPPGIIFAMVIAPRLRWWRRLLMEAATVLGIAGLVATSGRASWAIMLATTIAMGIVSRRAAFGRILIVAVIAAAVLQTTVSLKVTDRATSAFQGNDVSAEARDVEFTSVTLPFVLTHPFGAGTGTMSATGSAKVWTGGSAIDLALQKGYIHNGFLLVAIETGWLGLAVYVWLLLTAILTSWRQFQRARDPLVRDVALACFGSMLFFTAMNFATSMLTQALTSFDFWVFLGLISMLPHLDAIATSEGAVPADPLERLPAGVAG